LADVLLGERRELPRALRVEADVHLGLAELAGRRVRRGEVFAGERNVLVDQESAVRVAGALLHRGGHALQEALPIRARLALDGGEQRLAILGIELRKTLLLDQRDSALLRRRGLLEQSSEEWIGVVDHPELELRGGADQLLRPLRVLIPGERDLNRVISALPDVGFGDAP